MLVGRKTDVIILMPRDLVNVMRFIFSGTRARPQLFLLRMIIIASKSFGTYHPGPLFIKPTEVLPQDLVKPQSREIQV